MFSTCRPSPMYRPNNCAPNMYAGHVELTPPAKILAPNVDGTSNMASAADPNMAFLKGNLSRWKLRKKGRLFCRNFDHYFLQFDFGILFSDLIWKIASRKSFFFRLIFGQTIYPWAVPQFSAKKLYGWFGNGWVKVLFVSFLFKK